MYCPVPLTQHSLFFFALSPHQFLSLSFLCQQIHDLAQILTPLSFSEALGGIGYIWHWLSIPQSDDAGTMSQWVERRDQGCLSIKRRWTTSLMIERLWLWTRSLYGYHVAQQRFWGNAVQKGSAGSTGLTPFPVGCAATLACGPLWRDKGKYGLLSGDRMKRHESVSGYKLPSLWMPLLGCLISNFMGRCTHT